MARVFSVASPNFGLFVLSPTCLFVDPYPISTHNPNRVHVKLRHDCAARRRKTLTVLNLKGSSKGRYLSSQIYSERYQ